MKNPGRRTQERRERNRKGVARVSHWGSAYRALGQCQPTDRALVIGLAQRLEVVLPQEQARLLLLDLKRELEQELLQGQEQELFRVLEQERGLGQRQKQAEGLVLVLGLGRRPG